MIAFAPHIERPGRWPAAQLPLNSPERWERVRELYRAERNKEPQASASQPTKRIAA